VETTFSKSVFTEEQYEVKLSQRCNVINFLYQSLSSCLTAADVSERCVELMAN